MQTMHLFAGIGGGLLADLILGDTPIVAVEWDKYACAVLRERASEGWFPKLSVWEGDVRKFDPAPYASRVDAIHAGFPCQDISVAGNQSGLGEGTRSGLYREVLRIACVLGYPELRLENVSAILSGGLGTVLADLAALGYDCRWLCIRASDVGAWHQRDRWFLLATHAGSKRVQGIVKKSVSGGGGVPWCKNVRGVEDLRRRPDLPSPLVRRIRDGIPFYVDRIKGCGNAQVPLQAAVAFSLLYEGLEPIHQERAQ